MSVTMPKLENLDVASASLYSMADRTGTGACKSGFAILFPRLVQRLESRRRERLAGFVEPLVEVVAA
jgi:hypothetical protein